MTTTPQAEPKPLAEIQEVDVTPSALDRCDRCGAQAYIEVEMPSGGRLGFCVHHFVPNEPALVLQAKRIIDHRPALHRQERAFKGADQR